ncbi:Crp/Fnr family transcriptional regulator [Sphingomonas sp. DG1-23]|uniref:Crp/Fnr family transcriptional regulator n=1 Tax=Sphingomonas sp. DG1-23 TaxID=3068316 RepID=UPI00273EA304|nr:Crp/Fnr family transcriptional regulator [Sphingomonas sp. DG1-23]MDP5280123.1 Crp/Fnr family transcriptional regulator [Sphingomonas sp. DG1-23]
MPRDYFEAWISKMHALNTLQESDIAAIRKLPTRSVEITSGTTIISEGQLVSECCILLEGFACRSKLNREGGRQIVSFHMAGDMLDIQHLLFDKADHNVEAISAATVVFFPMADLRKIVDDNSGIAKALWRDCLVDASIFREWVLNVGRRDAKSRVAHMLCEFAARREAAGLGSPERFDLPMTQEQIGDATGLTAVHVNRMLRQLEEEGVFERNGRNVRISDWAQMKRVAEFDDGYLHLAA